MKSGSFSTELEQSKMWFIFPRKLVKDVIVSKIQVEMSDEVKQGWFTVNKNNPIISNTKSNQNPTLKSICIGVLVLGVSNEPAEMFSCSVSCSHPRRTQPKTQPT